MLRQGPVERTASIDGVLVPAPPPALYMEIMGARLAAPGVALRCEVVGEGPPALVHLSYLAWHDKSGDVWRDVGLMLLGQGLVSVAPGPRPPDDEYVRAEEDARRRAVGIWSDSPGRASSPLP